MSSACDLKEALEEFASGLKGLRSAYFAGSILLKDDVPGIPESAHDVDCTLVFNSSKDACAFLTERKAGKHKSLLNRYLDCFVRYKAEAESMLRKPGINQNFLSAAYQNDMGPAWGEPQAFVDFRKDEETLRHAKREALRVAKLSFMREPPGKELYGAFALGYIIENGMELHGFSERQGEFVLKAHDRILSKEAAEEEFARLTEGPLRLERRI